MPESMFESLLRISFLVYGLCVGSFLNVCIYRLPQSLSLIRPASSCPKCNTPIKFYDNIPVLSYILLLGKCRKCKNPISIRYPLIEALTGLLWMFCFMKFGLTAECFIHILFVSTLVVITFIDIDHGIIPDRISLPGIPIFFVCGLFLPEVGLRNSIIGILLGGGSLLIVAEGYRLITKLEGMGGGDIKLLAMIGALIGWKGVFFTIFMSSAVGTVVGLAVMVATRNNMKLSVPFGPFLSLGALIYVFFGTDIISWYLGTSGIMG
jgi:leader peptidase (prepilin peptidase)/N-methyltransferase